MSKNNWQTTIEGIGITAVVISLLLVVMEIRQNNELMEAEARYNRLQVALQANYLIAESTNFSLAQLLLKPTSELDVEENLVRTLMGDNTFRINEWSFRELPRNELPLEAWRQIMVSYPGAREVWEQRSNRYDSEYSQGYSENAIDEIPN